MNELDSSEDAPINEHDVRADLLPAAYTRVLQIWFGNMTT